MVTIGLSGVFVQMQKSKSTNVVQSFSLMKFCVHKEHGNFYKERIFIVPFGS